jgi:hypothetical protein
MMETALRTADSKKIPANADQSFPRQIVSLQVQSMDGWNPIRGRLLKFRTSSDTCCFALGEKKSHINRSGS